MVNAECVTKLAEALADGQAPDWSSADLLGDTDRELIAELRAVASIGQLFGTLPSGGPAASARTQLPAGVTWGGLRILEHVGTGRFGDVYRAWDPALEREVALKLIPRVAGDDDDASSQVVEEGRLMARVHHPNVVAIFGAQRIGETTGLWMEFVQGRSLAHELGERGPFGMDDLVTVGSALCRALQAVHDAGLVHRDVKTQNVMRDVRGRVVLGDFGVGRELDTGRNEGLAGTPAYIAPEIFAGQPATPQSDLYSVGVLMFQLATSRYPVEGRSLGALRDAHRIGQRTALRTARPELPDTVADVIDRALSHDPKARYATADAMADALDATRDVSSQSRRPLWAAAAVVLTTLVAAATLSLAGRPADAPFPLAARDWVLVTAFENRTGEPTLDGVFEFALERELTASTFVNIVPRARVLDALQLMQRPPDTRIDATVGRELAVRDGQIRAVINGRLDRLGPAYTMTATVVSPATGVIFASASESSRAQDDLLNAARRLALRVRQRLGETLAEAPAPTPLPKVTTRSLPALQLYGRAVAMQNAEGTWNREESTAVQLLTQSIAHDPEFASAHMLLSTALRLEQAPRLSQVLHHAERAVALSGHASDVERLVNLAEWYAATALIKGAAYGQAFSPQQAAEIEGLRQQAIASYRAVLELEPNNYQALICLANMQRMTQPEVSVSKALADLRPHSATWQVQAAIDLLATGRRNEAISYVQRAREMPMINPGAAFSVTVARLFDAYAAWMHGDARAAKRVVDHVASELEQVPKHVIPTVAAPIYRAYIALGQLDRAEHFAAMNGTNALVIAAMSRDNRDHLRAVLARSFPTVNEGTGVSSAFVMAGLLNDARARLALLRQQPLDVPRLLGPPAASVLNYLALVEGQIAVAEGRNDAAIAIFNEYLRHQPVGATGDRWILATHSLARAWAGKGEYDRAIHLLEGVPWRLDLVMQPSNFNLHWLDVRNDLSSYYRAVGRTRDADEVDGQLRELLGTADDGHPIKRRLALQAAR
jgi:tetratricopeptide (TPR) repeat protein